MKEQKFDLEIFLRVRCLRFTLRIRVINMQWVSLLGPSSSLYR